MGAHTFARFFRHSVHAFGVTTPKPRRLFATPCALAEEGPEIETAEAGDGPGAVAGCLPPATEVEGEGGGRAALWLPLGASSSIGSIVALDATRAIGSTKDLVSLH